MQARFPLRGFDSIKNNEEKHTEFMNTRVTPSEKKILKLPAEPENLSMVIMCASRAESSTSQEDR
ncbi:hypothetical protein [Maridesulfovibrio ferrireducens]|uniref:hypothetical protein n=1 Tax=Maridesulfovibrio ferrireducens TaxID=246191 RepID=UPI00111354DB|nr:hypothetical protein [Maridesulfovibrio ferrireducens]